MTTFPDDSLNVATWERLQECEAKLAAAEAVLIRLVACHAGDARHIGTLQVEAREALYMVDALSPKGDQPGE